MPSIKEMKTLHCDSFMICVSSEHLIRCNVDVKGTRRTQFKSEMK